VLGVGQLTPISRNKRRIYRPMNVYRASEEIEARTWHSMQTTTLTRTTLACRMISS
jgi:hypothetical protein